MQSDGEASAAEWSIHHVHEYVEASAVRRIGIHSTVDVEAWSGGLGRIGGMAT